MTSGEQNTHAYILEIQAPGASSASKELVAGNPSPRSARGFRRNPGRLSGGLSSIVDGGTRIMTLQFKSI